MARVGFPLHRFASAGHHDARAGHEPVRPSLHAGSQVHQQAHGTEHPLGMMHQPHQLAEVCFAAQIQHPAQGRVDVPPPPRPGGRGKIVSFASAGNHAGGESPSSLLPNRIPA